MFFVLTIFISSTFYYTFKTKIGIFYEGMCPRGNDPYTNSNAHARISIKTSTPSGALTGGYFVFYFLDQSFRFEADVGVWDAAACKTSFEGLRNVDSVACSLSYNHDGGVTYVVEFKKVRKKTP